MDDRENRNYITSRVHPIFEKMILDLLLVKPDDLVDYMIAWLHEKGRQFRTQAQLNRINYTISQTPTMNSQIQTFNSSSATTTITAPLPQSKRSQQPSVTLVRHTVNQLNDEEFPHSSESEDEFDSDDEDEEIGGKSTGTETASDESTPSKRSSSSQGNQPPQKFLQIKPRVRTRRFAVSSISSSGSSSSSSGNNSNNQSMNDSQQIIPQSSRKRIPPNRQESKDKIIKKVKSLFIFNVITREGYATPLPSNQTNSTNNTITYCDDSQLSLLINQFEERRYRAGEIIYKKGENAEHIFIVESGTLAKTLSSRVYQSGDSFGEVALLYNSIRTESISAKSDVTLWSLSRTDFQLTRNIMAESYKHRCSQFIESSNRMLALLKDSERNRLLDAIVTIKLNKGDYLCKQGEQANYYYFLEKGELLALRIKNPGGDPEILTTYKTGSGFSEIALSKSQLRPANIIAKSDSQLLAIERLSFKRLFGCIEEIQLRENGGIKKVQF